MSAFWMHGARFNITLNHTGSDVKKELLSRSTSIRVSERVYEFPNIELSDAIERFESILVSDLLGKMELPDVIYCVYSTFLDHYIVDWTLIEQGHKSRKHKVEEL